VPWHWFLRPVLKIINRYRRLGSFGR